jgi:hypothetical protein
MLTGIRVIKLTSGDTIVAKLTKLTEQGPYVQIDDPVQFTMMYRGGSEGSLVAQQWLETDETSFSIHKMQIVAEAEPNDMLKDYYFSSLEEINQDPEEDILLNFDGILH